jgi:hypothetical protein
MTGIVALWPMDWSHAKTNQSLGITNSHQQMQQHKGRLRDECAAKQAAFQTLVKAGRILPDSGRTR